ncbi:probable ribonuclease P/MRP protein subunit POP5 [Gossypium raimondii]|uniref:Ribonuclease P/MRP protein subunit POP5 n=1 Tax=Gossypium raimondii TaxID=29730 RepID=A0A0D2PQX2_GOSRA|nr:probable ribonuclease P/MRP protein subunit POP5 [Gossypium raimondii]XP_012440718.1 probable ribonuclease P/MRP protein subunit POP5 [Gossypium raimondii]XP_012447714.1 probable ribonuclease P/MRP protein subunit POP5 [Gossypium raimondii]XP_012453878.1 probable ribonuclease P/MRP protein subunit POP5 [Gossypium raimondii]KJB06349.1 hypothetical protein B456_001G000500 [Gossypium raimondii]KJB06351.1 hypothetical protein B456_001G000500 [Gossypium raimondii]KJB06353.1 hypothetical protein
MVGFKNSYMVMEVLLDPNKEISGDDPIVVTQFNISKAIKDGILVNFGECGLASSLGSFQVKYVNPITKLCVMRASRDEYQKIWSSISMVRSIGNCPVLFNLLDLSGSIKACKTATLKCDELKFEQYKLMVGACLSADVTQHMQNCLEKIRILEH